MDLYTNNYSGKTSLYNITQTLAKDNTRDNRGFYEAMNADDEDDVLDPPLSWYIVNDYGNIELYINNYDGEDCDVSISSESNYIHNSFVDIFEGYVDDVILDCLGYPKLIYLLKILKKYIKRYSPRPSYYSEDYELDIVDGLIVYTSSRTDRFSISRYGQMRHKICN